MELPGGTYVDLDDLGNARTGSIQDGLDVVAAGLGLDADVALDQVGRGVGGDLAGDEDLAVGTDGLGLWCVSILHVFTFNVFDGLVSMSRVESGRR